MRSSRFTGFGNTRPVGNMGYFYSVPSLWGILIPEIRPHSLQELPVSMPRWEPNLGFFGINPTSTVGGADSGLGIPGPALVLRDDPGISLQHHLLSLLRRNSWPSSRTTAGKSRAPGDGSAEGLSPERRSGNSRFRVFGFPLSVGVGKEHPRCKKKLELGTD